MEEYTVGTVALDRYGTAWQKRHDDMWHSTNALEIEERYIRREFEHGWLKFVHIPSSDDTLRRWLEIHLDRHRYAELSTADLAHDIMLLIEEAQDEG